jgi:hypothetical protein
MRDELGGEFDRSGGGRQRRLRLGIVAGWSTVLATGGLAIATSGSAGADATQTQGSSYAQSLQVTPHEGSLAVGAVFGEALAGHTGTFARGQSQGLDLGAVGEAARGYNCNSAPQPVVYNGVPEPLQTESGAPGAAQGISEGAGSPSYPQQVASGVDTSTPQQLQNNQLGGYYVAPGTDYLANEFVQATTAPYGEADTTYAGPVGDPTNKFFTVSGMHSKAWSGVINGVSETAATEDIGSVNIGGGAVVLNHLHWEVHFPDGGNPTGSFTIGQVSIGGVPLPGNPDLTQVASAVNAALANLGMVVQFPGSTLAQGIEFESPLQVEVVPDPSRDQVTTTITGTVQNGSLPGGQTLPGGGPYYNVTNGLENGLSNTATPYNKSLGDALGQIEPAQIAQVLCQSDTPITVADVTIASFDGGGYFNFALGGVNASAGPLPPNPYNLSLFSLGNSLGSSQFLAGSLGTAGTPGTGGNVQPSNGLGHGSKNVRALHRLTGTAARSTLLAAGLGGLGLLVLLVEGDRRMMRRARRRLNVEDRTG